MKTKQTAIIASIVTSLSFVAFAFCVSVGVSGTSSSLSRKAPVHTVSFTDEEVPVYRGYRPTSVTKVTFDEQEVPSITVSPKGTPKAYASR